MEKKVKNGMEGMAPPVRPPVSSATRKSKHTESQRDSLKAAINLHNLLNATLTKKPVVPKPADVPSTSLKESVAPGDVDSLLGMTASGTGTGEVGEPTTHQDILVDLLES